MSSPWRPAPLGADLPGVAAPAVLLVERVAGVALVGAVGVALHAAEGQRLDGRPRGGERRTILAVAPRPQHEAPRPARRQLRQLAGVEADGQLVAGAEDDEAVVGVAQQR